MKKVRKKSFLILSVLLCVSFMLNIVGFSNKKTVLNAETTGFIPTISAVADASILFPVLSFLLPCIFIAYRKNKNKEE